MTKFDPKQMPGQMTVDEVVELVMAEDADGDQTQETKTRHDRPLTAAEVVQARLKEA